MKATMIITVSLLLFSSVFSSTYLNSASEIIVKKDPANYLYYYTGSKDTLLLHFSKDRLTKSSFTKTNDNDIFKTDSDVKVDSADASLKSISITKSADKSVLVNSRFTYVFSASKTPIEEINSLGKYVNDGYLLPSLFGKPRTGFFGIFDATDGIIKKSDKEDSIVTKDGKKVYVCSADWMLESKYNAYAESLPVKVESGADFFNGNNDYKLGNQKKIPFGNGIKAEEGGVVKAGNEYIASYFGLPLYVSKDDKELKTSNGRTYYSINIDGTVNIGSEKVVPFTADFENKFKTIVSMSTMIKLGSMLLVLIALIF